MSALFSAGTILFLFWTITALTGRLVWGKGTEISLSAAQALVVLGSGVVGALVYTWSDSFWFSAVEAEVYGFSSFMTALTFWLILYWERQADDVAADRFLILIAYIVGLSIGVHLLNLLCLPAIVLIYYFHRSRKVRLWQMAGIVLLSFVLIGLILYVLIPGVVWLAQKFELLFVNGFGWRYNTGALACFLLLFAMLVGAMLVLWQGHVPQRMNGRLAFNLVTMLLMLLIGYSTYAQVLIRSSAQLPMNENTPDNVFSLARYLNREQYGSSPLLYGQTFASEVIRDASKGQGTPLYAKVVKLDESEPDRYYEFDRQRTYEYDYNMFFPRMYSNAFPEHIQGYKQWSNFKGKMVQVPTARGGTRKVRVPTFGENLTYFFRYQLGHMYWRYFFWNFCGRQSDLKCNGEADRGNWITGIPFIDEWLVGNQTDLPRFIAENKGHNVYYMLPLLLGLLGIGWQWSKGREGKQGFLVILMLFLMTGMAIVVYINQPPFQPRERDYSFAGSFYAFSIWVGMGVAAVAALLRCGLRVKSQTGNLCLAVLACVLCLGVPLQMVSQTWDDHDRSDRYLAHDFGQNYLASLDPEGIIFTNGDNDTFPLWYAMEVEGFRTDTRACNLCYLQVDWYIDQMKSPAYDSPALPIPYRREQYAGNNLAYSLLKKQELTLPGDSICSTMHISLEGKQYLQRHEIMQLAMIDSIARTGWKRPIYYACSSGSALGLQPYLRTVGLAYQVVPSGGGPDSVDVERTFDCLMNRFKWGNANKPGIYLDETCLSMCYWHRVVFSRLIDALLRQGDTERALLVTRRCMEVLPSYNIPYDYPSLTMVRCLGVCGKQEEANGISAEILEQTTDYLHWAAGLDKQRRCSCTNEIGRKLSLMQSTLLLLNEQQQTALFQTYYPLFQQYYEQYRQVR